MVESIDKMTAENELEHLEFLRRRMKFMSAVGTNKELYTEIIELIDVQIRNLQIYD